MEFTLIDRENWERKDYFEHYFSGVPCRYGISVKTDITRVRKSGEKLYPVLLYCVGKVVNAHREFRMAFDKEGRLGFFGRLNPSYTVFHKDTQTFSNLWTQFDDDYEIFRENYRRDLETFGSRHGFDGKPDPPENLFTLSMIPWVQFDSFHLDLPRGENYLLPIFTAGKFFEREGKVFLPLAMQVHHAVCDGFHAGRFLCELSEKLASFSPHGTKRESDAEAESEAKTGDF